jgi:hypothetical protein
MRVFDAATLSLLLATPLAAGCSSSAPVSSAPENFAGPPLASMPSRAGEYEVAIRTSPAVPSQGEQSVEYTITDSASGQPASGLSLAVVPWMPAMGHGTSVVPAVAETSQGVYVATPVDWFMPGQWVLRTTITAADAGLDGDGGVAGDYVEPSCEIP